MKAYCINREQFDYVLDVTKFKTKAEWAEDPMKDVDTKTKSAFTRTFNKTVCVCCGGGCALRAGWGCQGRWVLRCLLATGRLRAVLAQAVCWGVTG